MEKKLIKLVGEKELRIFMHPLRQKILRAMAITGVPITAKQLADRLKITPSAAKHHLTQLESIGVVGKDHTEQIHGITATYYRHLPVTVSIGLGNSEYADERNMIAENALMNVYGEFKKKCSRRNGLNSGEHFEGDMSTGVVYLDQQSADALHALIERFLQEHNTVSEHSIPFEFALILYNTLEK